MYAIFQGGHRGHDHMLVTTTYVISGYHHKHCEFDPPHGEVYLIQHYVIKWFSVGTPVSSTNKTNCHDITEILLKGALNTITHNPLFQVLSIFNLLYSFLLAYITRMHKHRLLNRC